MTKAKEAGHETRSTRGIANVKINRSTYYPWVFFLYFTSSSARPAWSHSLISETTWPALKAGSMSELE